MEKKAYSESWPPFVKRLLSHMQFVAGVGPQQKLCFRTQTYVSADGKNSWAGIVGSLTRLFYREDRDDLIRQIESIRLDAVTVFQTYEGRDDYLRSIIYRHMLGMERGLIRLMDVYPLNEYPLTYTQLCSLRQQISIFNEQQKCQLELFTEQDDSGMEPVFTK